MSFWSSGIARNAVFMANYAVNKLGKKVLNRFDASIPSIGECLIRLGRVFDSEKIA